MKGARTSPGDALLVRQADDDASFAFKRPHAIARRARLAHVVIRHRETSDRIFSPGETVKGPIGLSAANHCIEGFKPSDDSCDILLIFIKIAFKSDNYDGLFRSGRMDFIDMSFNRVRKRVLLLQAEIK
ncbi:hypothetical protein [Burkholderia sp. Tr-849]|uniref:hypothetical protein n=1 Tax=Burkholderia sp. Tr-849 TaxID=2608330 RepID=UPI001421EB91|nr:hypothetical protein [Burkholderia sp. Tr-849]